VTAHDKKDQARADMIAAYLNSKPFNPEIFAIINDHMKEMEKAPSLDDFLREYEEYRNGQQPAVSAEPGRVAEASGEVKGSEAEADKEENDC
jgi:5,10-methenyltetrahydromethanopterin hydrogenase